MSHLAMNDIGGGLGNDIWGWQDSLTGKEYAMMGRSTGTAFVDISDPLSPIYLGNLPPHSGNSQWRDMKVYLDHAFIVTEASRAGMQVFDLTQLRTVSSPPVTFSETAHYSGFSDAHNIAINEDSGFAYAVRTNTCDGGLHMINIQNPTNPTSAGCFSEDGYTHDAQCVNYIGPDPDHQGAEICFNSNTDTLTIVDVTNKAAPEMLSRTGYTGSGYTHQGWLTEDHAYFVLGDEYDESRDPTVTGTTTYLWDVSDLDSPTLVGTHVSTTTRAIDHNQFVKGKYTYQANYQAGLRILDVTDIANGNLTEVAFFDMLPDSDSPEIYEGTWGNYPFFDSGIVIVSVREQGLFVLRPNLVDRIQPKVGRATVDRETLTLTYGEALDETSTPAMRRLHGHGGGRRAECLRRLRERERGSADACVGSDGRRGGDGHLHRAADKPNPGRGAEQRAGLLQPGGAQRHARAARHARRPDGHSGLGYESDGDLGGAAEGEASDHRLRRAVPDRQQRRLHRLAARRDRPDSDNPQSDRGHGLRGAGAGEESRRDERLVAFGQRHARAAAQHRADGVGAGHHANHRERPRQGNAGRDGDRPGGRHPDLRLGQLARWDLRRRLGPRHDLDRTREDHAAQDIVLTLTVTDDGAGRLTHAAEVNVRVRENQRPTASVSPDTATVDGGGAVTLRGTASDPDTTTLTYAWTSSGSGSFHDASALDTTWTAPPKTNAAQDITLTLTVTDDGYVERAATVTVQVTVRANLAPAATATATTPTTVNGGGTVTLRGMAGDGDGADLTYDWRSNGGGSFADSSALDTTWTAPRATTADELVVLTLTVTDTASASATATVSVTVRENQAPRVTVSPVTTTVEGDETVAVSGTATDPEGDGLTYAWSSNGGGSFDNASAPDTTWTAPATTADVQNIILTLTVTDDGAGRLTHAAEVRVTVPGDQPPPGPIIIGGGGGGGGGGGPTPSELDFEWTVKRDIDALDSGHDTPSGVWSDGVTLWVLENGDGTDDAVYAYDVKSGERVEGREFELDDTNRAPRGVWSDRSTVWVSDSGRNRLFAHDLESGERLEERDIALADRNRDARGIWSGDETMWVLDGGKDSLFAYDLTSGELLGEYELASANGDPHGVWSDGVTVWVSDHGAKRLFAYRLPARPETPAAEDAEPQELERVIDEEFKELSRASNNSPRGLWSGGDVMYVADASDARVYSYNMPDAIDARLASLSLSGVDIGEFSPNHEEYEGAAGEGVTETTVTAEALQRRTDVDIDPPDADVEADGHQVALEDLTEITVTVTSADGSRERVYHVRLSEPEQAAASALTFDCFRGDVAVSFSLVVYGGGSIEDLEVCAQSRSVTALYVPHEGDYVPYILGAPDFVNEAFVALFPDGLPALTPLIAKSEGPTSPVPASDDVPDFGADCLRGTIASGFSLALYEGGSVDDLDSCAQGRDVTAVYALAEGEYVPYILGAPDFVNEAFVALFPEGLAAVTPLIAKSD